MLFLNFWPHSWRQNINTTTNHEDVVSVQSFCFELMENFLSPVFSPHVGQKWDFGDYKCLLLKLLLLGWARISVGMLCKSSVLLGYYRTRVFKKSNCMSWDQSKYGGKMDRCTGGDVASLWEGSLTWENAPVCNWEWWPLANIFLFFEEGKIILNFINWVLLTELIDYFRIKLYGLLFWKHFSDTFSPGKMCTLSLLNK